MGPWRPEPHDGNASPSRPGRRSMRQILLLALIWLSLRPAPGRTRSHGTSGALSSERWTDSDHHDIYNGTPMSYFPAVVGLAIANRDGTAGICTGTLIAPSAAPTAAHCLAFDPIRVVAVVYPAGPRAPTTWPRRSSRIPGSAWHASPSPTSRSCAWRARWRTSFPCRLRSGRRAQARRERSWASATTEVGGLV